MGSSAALVAKLAALGLSARQLAGVVAVIEEADEERRAAKREGNRERQARRRSSRDVTRDTPPVTRDPPSPKERSPLDPPKETTPSPPLSVESGARSKRGSRVDGFEPDISVAVAAGMTERWARAEALEFVDYWRGIPGQRGVKCDWPATWRNQVRKRIAFHGPGDGPQPRGGFNDRRTEHVQGGPLRGGGRSITDTIAEHAERRRQEFARLKAGE